MVSNFGDLELLFKVSPTEITKHLNNDSLVNKHADHPLLEIKIALISTVSSNEVCRIPATHTHCPFIAGRWIALFGCHISYTGIDVWLLAIHNTPNEMYIAT